MSTGTFAVVLIIGILLLLLMTRYRSIFFVRRTRTRPTRVLKMLISVNCILQRDLSCPSVWMDGSTSAG